MANPTKYTDFKASVIDRSPIRREINFRDLKIVSTEIIEYRGNPIEIEASAFKSLLRQLNVPLSLLKSFKKFLSQEQSIQFLNSIRQIMSHSNQKIVMVVDKNSKKIINILPPNQTVVSNELFFDVFEKTVEKYSTLEVRQLHYSPKNGVSINTVNNEWEFGIKGLADETFRTGINFKNDFVEGLVVNPYNERLACTNGMVFARDSAFMRLNQLSDISLTKFLQMVCDPNCFRKYEELFTERVKRMQAINASFYELSDAYDFVKAKLHHTATPDMLLNPIIPMHDVIGDYKLHNIDVVNLAVDFKKNARTEVKIWDLVNVLTYHASHKESELNLLNADRLDMQVYAGRLSMKKNYDTETLLPDIYRKN